MALPHAARYDCSDGYSFSSNPRTRSHIPARADWNPASALATPSQSQNVPQETFAFYNAILNTDASPGGGTNEPLRYDDSSTRNTDVIGAQEGEGQQCGVRAIPYHLDVRFANRSNGAPLSTIIEQGSYSTLNSGGSLLGASHLPSSSSAGMPSPGGAAYRDSRILDGSIVDRSPENTPQKYTMAHASGAYRILSDNDQHHRIIDTTTPITTAQELPQSPKMQISEPDTRYSDVRPRDVLRGLLQNVRAASRTQSRSSSLTHTPVVGKRDSRPETNDSSPLCQVPGDYHGPKQAACLTGGHTSNAMQSLFSTTPHAPILSSRPTNRKTSLTSHSVAAGEPTCQPSKQLSLPPFKHIHTPEPIPRTLVTPGVWPSRDRASSVRLVPPEPRDVACVTASVGASTFSERCNDINSTLDTFYGVSVLSESASSLHKHECAKQPSQNTSFCSTLSTSYSGTVLGVDLDLQFKTPGSVRHSSSPMPV
ncbi:hypothetical protein HBI56_214770 [Parastagonospora nodorum]|nr:hypothetical protein HBH52_237750 [Parastagonospora nodorum]KAH3993661.1 hypothetical protein HBI10_199120 [Parastagonospora nodorum]KAH4012269.1 hypothetical protein HBI13_191040 [Parastagonospora nodorum]KAH4097437.1 hypothetical protein HBH46_162230 [Parastagonospora nodorum]KAH4401740.1 hypothetical protein HBH92_220190 [Parastagonospora nodorum]